MSVPVRPDVAAFQELELLVRNLAEELATFRRRALTAEARVKELEGAEAATELPPDAKAKLATLERENGKLREQLEATGERAGRMLERVHFLRQQAGANGGGNDK
ncbi:MAG TPA: hypothetical protein VGD77_07290 [Gemmatimonadaceae bacterium]